MPCVISADNMTECSSNRLAEPTKFTWSGGTSPYYLSLIPGSFTRSLRLADVTDHSFFPSWSTRRASRRSCLFFEPRIRDDPRKQIKAFPVQTGNEFTWRVSLGSGSTLFVLSPTIQSPQFFEADVCSVITQHDHVERCHG